MPYIVFIAFFCLGVGLRQGALMDPDTGWHIAAGDYIRAHGLPASDPWSYTAGDAPWYNLSWLFDVVLSLVHGFGGLDAVVVAAALFYALAVAFVCWIAQKSSGSLIASLAVTALAGFVLLPGMLARPQLFTFLLILGFYWVLRFGGARMLLALPVLTALWANVHGGFLAGFVMLGMFFLEALVGGERKRALYLVAAGAACLLALLLNPYGWHILEAASLTMNSALKDVLLEWRPTELTAGSPVWLLVIVFAGVSALFEKSIPLADKLLACFWLAAGLMSARMMQIAALMSAPYLAQALALRLGQSPVGGAIEARDRDYAADLSKAAVRGVLACASVIFVAAAFAPPVQKALAGGEAFVETPASHAPESALAYADGHFPEARLFANYGFGGYILYCCRDVRPVFVDGRADTAYPRKVLEDAIVLGFMDGRGETDEQRAAEWKALTETYGIDGFLASTRSALLGHLMATPGWAKVYEDDDAALFMRAELARAKTKHMAK
ncbi:hypothetical protein [Hyphococcus luteus]|uniref:Glycosyltransferase RgtA/B/C/D-like domain-containing protein n=1 Tax=Hyphococcus luteus TaxID=2058213 RepID=A0A2S7K7B7_9PROT|nr:hypothetical protein [Marinicaulis flavus]PQA88359.1 hypothetical protein CW354_08660 [Marinicaulis flavus]